MVFWVPAKSPESRALHVCFCHNVLLITSLHRPNTQSTLFRVWAASTVSGCPTSPQDLSEPTTSFPGPCHRQGLAPECLAPRDGAHSSGSPFSDSPSHRWPHGHKHRGADWGPPAWLRPGTQNPGSLLSARQALLPQDCLLGIACYPQEGWQLWKLLCFSAESRTSSTKA